MVICFINHPKKINKITEGTFDFDDNKLQKIVASRDHVGVRPLYYGKDENNSIIFSSELKGIPKEFTGEIKEFPCGCLYINDFSTIKEIDYKYIYNTPEDLTLTEDEYYKNIRDSLINAVKRRLIVDDNIEIGYYLSGGLDSSVICAIASKLQPNKKINS